jgi:uncharacterized protein DUF4333
MGCGEMRPIVLPAWVCMVALALFVAGCGGGGVDQAGVEAQVKSILAEGKLGKTVDSVACPSDMQPSTEVECTVDRGGASETVKVTIDADGEASYVESGEGHIT